MASGHEHRAIIDRLDFEGLRCFGDWLPDNSALVVTSQLYGRIEDDGEAEEEDEYVEEAVSAGHGCCPSPGVIARP
jgi:hypothetical protein